MPDSRYGPKPDQLAAMRDGALDDATWLNKGRLAELHRRGAQVAADAYPATVGGGGNRVAEGTHADPTAEKATSDQQLRDLIGNTIERTFGHLLEAANHLHAARLAAHWVLEDIPTELDRGGDTLPTCEACRRDVSNTSIDRIKSGYCEACYKQWNRLGRPERSAYERDRRNASNDVTPEADWTDATWQ